MWSLKNRAAAVALGPVIAATLLVATASAPPALAAPRKVNVVGGTPISVVHAPWQVYLRIGDSSACGGSILDAGRVLTAAHCLVPAGTTAPYPAAAVTVLAGFDDVSVWAPGGPVPPGAQVVGVAGLRVHPYYEEAGKADDVALLTLARPLDLSGPRAKPVGLAPVGGGPAHPAALTFSGYGMQVQGTVPDGKLYGATLTALSDALCRPNIHPNASATVQCVAAGAQAICMGDSGGPLLLGGVQVGVASYVTPAGCGRGPAGFADVTAPETRAFLDGAASIPLAPRQTGQTQLSSVFPPLVGSPMTCDPGSWTAGAALSYTFFDDRTGSTLLSGASRSFVPSAAHRGATVSCTVHATGAGGTSMAWSGTSGPVLADGVPPFAALTSARCRRRRCVATVSAYDSNSQGALRIRATVRQRTRGRCGRGTRRGRCSKLRKHRLAVRPVVGTTTYRAKSARLRRGRVTLRVSVVDAAGNPSAGRLTRRLRVR
jgi:trypsin